MESYDLIGVVVLGHLLHDILVELSFEDIGAFPALPQQSHLNLVLPCRNPSNAGTCPLHINHSLACNFAFVFVNQGSKLITLGLSECDTGRTAATLASAAALSSGLDVCHLLALRHNCVGRQSHLTNL